MKRDEKAAILGELLTGEEVADFRQTSLEQGIASLRQQQRRRRLVRMTALTGVPILLLLGLLTWRTMKSPSESTTRSNTTANVTAARGTPDIEFINDEQLFALFPERSLALVGKPGKQQLLFLDQTTASRAN